MKFLVDNWVLILAALTSGALLIWPLIQRGTGSGVSTQEAVRLINREKAVLVDVSDAAEYAAGHAAGARNVPLAQLPTHKDLPSNKTLPLILVCPTGSRAAKGAEVLRKAGHASVVSLRGGTAAWREASLPIERAAEQAVAKGNDKGGNKASEKAGDKATQKAS